MSDQSQEIGKLAAALSKAQGRITGALKDSKNPFFKSSYADLASVMDAIRNPFAENGLAVIQTTEVDDIGVNVITTLAHESGEWVRGKLRMIPKDSTPQGFGSAITYARRYALAAIAGVAQVDDDGNAASGRAGVTTVDPKGDEKDRADFDPKERDKYVSRFLDAFNLDADDVEIGKAVHAVHTEIAHKHDLYIAVGEGLGPKRTAIRKYLDILKKSQKAAA